VTRSVDDEEAGKLKVNFLSRSYARDVFLEVFAREICCSDLLRNTASLSSLDIRVSELVKNFSFACVNMTENTNDRAS